MLNKIGKLVAVTVMLVLGACTPIKSSRTAANANGHGNCTQTKYGEDCSSDSTKEFKECVRANTEQMTRTGADAYCRCATTGGTVLPSQNPAIPPTCVPAGAAGMALAFMPGGGYGATTMPGRYAGYPGAAVVMLPDPTPQGSIAMENAGFGGRTVAMPGSGAQPASSGPTQQDLDDLARSQAAQQAAICRARPQDPICCTSCKK